MRPLPLPLPRRGVVLLLWLALMAAALAQIVFRTPFSADLSAFLPARPDAEQRVLIEQLKAGLPARLLLLGIDGGSAQQRAAASRALAATLRASGQFEQVNNGETQAWADVGTWLFERRYALSPAVAPERFTAAGLRDAIGDTLSLLGTPGGNALKPLLERDPTGETQRIAEGLIPTAGPRTEDGVWASRHTGKNGGRALLMLTTAAAGGDLDAQARAIAAVRGGFAALAPAQRAGLTLQLSGAPLFSVDSRAGIEHEVKFLVITGGIAISALLLLAFASLPALLVAMLPVATGVVVGIASVSLAFGGVHGFTLGFGSTLIGEGVDYAIYYLIQARAGVTAGMTAGATADSPAVAGTGWRRWLATGWPTVRLGLLTSVCGFAALLFSGFPGLMQLGMFSVMGLAGAALSTRFVLPVLMPDGARGMGLRRQLGRATRRAVAWLPALRWVWLALGLAAAVLLWQRSESGNSSNGRGLWQSELSSLSPVSKEALALDASLRGDLMAGDGGAVVFVEGADAETALQRAEAVAERLDALAGQRAIGGYSSITHLLPSRATQARRLASLPDDATLRSALQQATQGGPLSADRLQPFIAEVAAARRRAPDTPDSVKGGPVAALVSALLLRQSDGSWAALLPLQPAQAGGSVDTRVLTAALRGLPGVQVLDIGIELGRLYRRYLDEAKAQAGLGALAVVALIALSLRSARRVLAVCQPLLLAVLLTIGGLVALGVPLGILHLVGLLLVVAVGSNYALFFDLLRAPAGAAGTSAGTMNGRTVDDPTADDRAVDDRTMDDRTMDDDTLASLALANMTTVLSFGLIAISSIPALSAIGRVVAPGALLALLLSAAFAPRRPRR